MSDSDDPIPGVNAHAVGHLIMRLQMVTHGQSTWDALNASVNHLGFLVAFSAPTLEGADKYIDGFAEDLKRIVRANWENSRQERLRMATPAGRA